MKKKRSLGETFLYLLNTIFAILLLFCYVLPFMPPKLAPSLSILSLTFPALYLINILFLVSWVLRLKKKFLLSAMVIGIGLLYFNNLYKIQGKKVLLNDDIKVMSYNVRLFNHFNWKKDSTTASKTYDFIEEKSPDILVVQEYYKDHKKSFSFPYKYEKYRKTSGKFGLAIFSKYPVINSGSLDLEQSANNIIYADIVKNIDTIRVYNIHLESFKLNTSKENFGEKDSEKLLARIKSAFVKQAEQIAVFEKHEKQWNGKKIIAGDFNNTPFSWVYNQVSKDKLDAFEEAGSGLGKTFDYFYPMRIDYILTSQDFVINDYQKFSVKYSDHFPIMARLQLKKTKNNN